MCKEYIEREAAINAMCRLCSDTTRDKCSIQDICNYVCRLEAVPAADVRPVVKAHWYWDKDGMDWGIGAWRCSACKTMSPMWWNCDRGSPMHKSGHNFCPNCGAMMEES